MSVLLQPVFRRRIEAADPTQFAACTCRPESEHNGSTFSDHGSQHDRTATVSIVIATLGRWGELQRTLEHVRHGAATRDWEIMVISDGGGEAPPPICRLATCVSRPHHGVWHARNEGAQRARGTYLIFIDDDIEVDEQWTRAVDSAVERASTAVTGPIIGRDRSVLSSARAMRYDRRYRGLRCGDPVGFLAGGNTVVQRECFLAAGGFPTDGPGADNGLVERLEARPQFCWGLAVGHRNDRGVFAAATAAFKSGWHDALRGRGVGSTATDLTHIGTVLPSLLNLLLLSVRATGWGAGRLRRGVS